MPGRRARVDPDQRHLDAPYAPALASFPLALHAFDLAALAMVIHEGLPIRRLRIKKGTCCLCIFKPVPYRNKRYKNRHKARFAPCLRVPWLP